MSCPNRFLINSINSDNEWFKQIFKKYIFYSEFPKAKMTLKNKGQHNVAGIAKLVVDFGGLQECNRNNIKYLNIYDKEIVRLIKNII